ncbi:hypothetical protein N9L79_02855 [Alphaproteobacteria bacterium]|nr:hypothetical protein [Alphaproteobacteria bacterium]
MTFVKLAMATPCEWLRCLATYIATHAADRHCFAGISKEAHE